MKFPTLKDAIDWIQTDIDRFVAKNVKYADHELIHFNLLNIQSYNNETLPIITQSSWKATHHIVLDNGKSLKAAKRKERQERKDLQLCMKQQQEEIERWVLEQIEERERFMQKYSSFDVPQLLRSEQTEVVKKISKFPRNIIDKLYDDFWIYDCVNFTNGSLSIDFNKLTNMQQRQL